MKLKRQIQVWPNADFSNCFIFKDAHNTHGSTLSKRERDSQLERGTTPTDGERWPMTGDTACRYTNRHDRMAWGSLLNAWDVFYLLVELIWHCYLVGTHPLVPLCCMEGWWNRLGIQSGIQSPSHGKERSHLKWNKVKNNMKYYQIFTIDYRVTIFTPAKGL